MKNKFILLLAIVSICLIQCNTIDTDFLISANGIGKLTKAHTVEDFSKVFEKDSVVNDSAAIRLGTTTKKYNVFEKGGTKLFTISTTAADDQKINNIRIFDTRYTTTEGINLNSTFKDIQAVYTVKNILNSMRNIIVTFKESNIYISIDKKDLPEDLRYNSNTTIEAVQIPDTAKIKYLMMDWE